MNTIFQTESLSELRINYMMSGLSRLSRRERQVLGAIIQTRTAKQLAKQLGISHRTVEVHRTRMLQKLGAHGILDLLAMLLKASMIGRLDLTSIHLSSR